MSYVMSAFGIFAMSAGNRGVLVAWRTRSIVFLLLSMVDAICAVIVFLESRPEEAPTSLLSQPPLKFIFVLLRPQFALNCITNLLMYSAMFVWLSGNMLVIVDGYGISPEIGRLFLAFGSTGFMAGAAIAGRLGTRLGPHKLIIAGSGIAIVAAAMIIVLHGLNVATGLAVALPALFWMLGHGLHYPQSMAAAVAPFPENAGAASSLIGFYQTTAVQLLLSQSEPCMMGRRCR